MIYIFYPSNIMGGAEYLLARTANLLHNNGFNVGLVDIEGGWLSANINNMEKKIITGNKKIKLEDEDILITTANFMYRLDVYFEKSNTKILLWTVQPYNIVINLPRVLKKIPFFEKINSSYLCYKKPIHQKIIKSIIKKNGMVSMDGECDKILFKTYGLNYAKFLPVFIDNKSFLYTATHKMDYNCIKIVWLGRIDLLFKIHILKKVLLDINSLNMQNLVFDIIGNGPGLNDLKNFAKNKLNFKINFLGEIENNSLSQILLKYDLGFAMGTSALDVASKKVPTILLDFSYSDVDDYKYRWIFETNEYTLGRDISLLSCNEIALMKSMQEIFNDLRKDKDILAHKCFSYVYNMHSSTSILEKLRFYISSSQFTMEDIYNYRLQKPFWNFFHNFLFKIRK